MLRRCSVFVLLTAALVIAPSVYGQGVVPNRSIVVLKQGAVPAKVAAVHGLAMDHVYSHALNGFAAVVPAGSLRKLKNDPSVALIEADQAFTASAPPTVQQAAQLVPYGVLRIGADTNPNFVSSPVIVDVAIIDTGIELSHPDLNVFKNVSCIRKISTGNDDNGHGTHVAGTVGALNNGVGVVGVAPGVRLWAVKVLDRNGSGWTSDVIKGVDYVTSNAASIEVANMSLGGGNSATLNMAIANSVAKGVVYVVAAGNSAANAGNDSPANSLNVLCVSAIVDTDGECGGLGPATQYGADDTFASFSNYGSVVNIAAPGVNIRSTYKGKTYATMSGTSMASPHVAGTVALFLAGINKPANAADVAAVRQFVISNSIPQTDVCGFQGDGDGIQEPLVDASTP